MPAFPCLSCPSLTTPTSLSRPAVPLLSVSSFPNSAPTFLACLDPPHLSVTVRTLPHLNAPRLHFRAFSFRPLRTRPLHFVPCLPDLNSPCITLLLAVLTHLACWASRNPDVTHPSMPAMPHPPVPVNRHRIAPLPPARTFLSASLVACHHKPCPTQTLPVNLHSSFRAC